LSGALAAALVAIGSGATPAPAQSAITIGSDLSLLPSLGTCIDFPCTVANTTHPTAQLTSPVDGVIVRWRVRLRLTPDSALQLKVIRPAAGGAFLNVNTGPTEPVSQNADTILTFATQQPIQAGDFLGVNTVGPGNSVLLSGDQPGVTEVRWTPGLEDGQSRAPTQTFSPPDSEVLINADIEPDCDSDGFGDETQDADVAACATPETTITKGPKAKTKKKQASFEFTSSVPGSTFECSLDAAAFAPCTSPIEVKVKKGKHNFQVRAKSPLGNADGSAASDDWKVKKKRKRR